MRNLGHLIVRLVAVAFALVLAFLGAALFLSFGLYSEMAGPHWNAYGGPPDGGLFVLVVTLASSPLIAAAALGPAAILIAIAEWLRLRGLTVNIVLGGLAALLAFLFSYDFAPEARLSNSTLIVLLATGFIGGFIYWLIAGRNAGRWLGELSPRHG